MQMFDVLSSWKCLLEKPARRTWGEYVFDRRQFVVSRVGVGDGVRPEFCSTKNRGKVKLLKRRTVTTRKGSIGVAEILTNL